MFWQLDSLDTSKGSDAGLDATGAEGDQEETQECELPKHEQCYLYVFETSHIIIWLGRN
jgi:hypothetical protein